jgi:hypothetical protein
MAVTGDERSVTASLETDELIGTASTAGAPRPGENRAAPTEEQA